MKSGKIFVSFLVISFFLISLNSFAQNKNQVADDMATKLQQKVLLSKDQTDKVKDILINYLQNYTQASLESAQKTLESILDKRQKAKYDIVKSDWWNSVQKEVSKIQ
jgi:hypothetical protein